MPANTLVELAKRDAVIMARRFVPPISISANGEHTSAPAALLDLGGRQEG
jgi:hypothetical protein